MKGPDCLCVDEMDSKSFEKVRMNGFYGSTIEKYVTREDRLDIIWLYRAKIKCNPSWDFSKTDLW